jgi:predicted ATPase
VTVGDGVRVLATSRERLGVDGEHVWPLDPLACDGDRPAAQRLFADRWKAAAGTPGTGDPGDSEAVDRIVRRLDGLPLAIEMAAARAATLGPAAVADQLDGELAPLDVLRSPRRTDEPRHHTLGAVVAWSEALLDPGERDLLAALGAFAGFVRAADIVAVTGRADAPDLLERLVERSLVIAEPLPDGVRFGMLATIRGHARRRLGAGGRRERLAERHARHVTAAVEAADAALRTPGEPAAQRRIDELADELRLAHRWATAHDLDLALRLVAALHVSAQARLRDEPMGWAATLAARADLPPSPAAGVVLASAAQRSANAGDLAVAEALATRGVALTEGTVAEALPLYVLSDVAIFGGRLEDCRDRAARTIAAAERGPDHYGLVGGACNLAMAQAYAGNRDEAVASIEAAAARWEGEELSPSERGWLAYARGECLLDTDPPRALALLDEAIAGADAAGNRYLGGVARVSASSLVARTGEPAEAVAAFARAIDHWRRETTVSFLATTLRNLVTLLMRLGAAGEAAELLATVAGDAAGPTYGDEAARLAEAEAWARDTLRPEEWAARTAVGAARTTVEAGAESARWLARLGGP